MLFGINSNKIVQHFKWYVVYENTWHFCGFCQYWPISSYVMCRVNEFWLLC